jgi:hypothetical protein
VKEEYSSLGRTSWPSLPLYPQPGFKVHLRSLTPQRYRSLAGKNETKQLGKIAAGRRNVCSQPDALAASSAKAKAKATGMVTGMGMAMEMVTAMEMALEAKPDMNTLLMPLPWGGFLS